MDAILKKSLSPKWYAFFWALLLGLWSASLWPLYRFFKNGKELYKDIIASNLVYNDLYKQGDIYFSLTAFLLAGFCFLLLFFFRPQSEQVQEEAPAIGNKAGWGSYLLSAISLLSLNFFLHNEFVSETQGALLVNPSSLGIAIFILLQIMLFIVSYREHKNGIFLSTGFLFVLGFWTAKQGLPSSLLLDDYHTGEMHLPFRQFFSHGLSAYEEFFSVHGLLAVIYGAINEIFFHSNYSTIPISENLTRGFFGGALAITLGQVLPRKSWVLLFLVPFALPAWDRYFLLALLCLWIFSLEKKELSLRQMILFCYAVVFSLFVNPVSGLAFALALSIWVLCREKKVLLTKIYHWKWLLLLAFLPLVFFYKNFYGLLVFIQENAQGTNQAFGITLENPQEVPKIFTRLAPEQGLLWSAVYKGLKLFGWLAGLWILVLFWRKEKRYESLFLFLFVLGFFLTPYLYGRIGTQGLDRVGGLSVFYLSLLVPLALYQHKAKSRFYWTVFCLVLVLSFSLRFLASYSKLPSLQQLAGIYSVNAWHDGKPSAGLPLWGGGMSPPELKFKEFQAYGDFIKKNPEAKIWDFTERQIFFFLADQKVPQGYPSLLIATNEALQHRVLEQVRKNKPEWAFLSPRHGYDTFGPSLRSYRVYRSLIEEGGISSLNKEASLVFASLSWNGFPKVHKEQLEELRKILIPEHLGALPCAWGRSWPELSKRFHIVDFSEADFLLVNKGKDSGQFSVIFEGPVKGNLPSFDCYSSSDFILIPIGSDPLQLMRQYESVKVSLKGTLIPESNYRYLRLVR